MKLLSQLFFGNFALVSVHLKLASKFSSQFFVLLVYEGFFGFVLF